MQSTNNVFIDAVNVLVTPPEGILLYSVKSVGMYRMIGMQFTLTLAHPKIAIGAITQLIASLIIGPLLFVDTSSKIDKVGFVLEK